jgi:RNA polymerase sigma-70 factor (ECF subfamily)
MSDVTLLLRRYGDGDQNALAELMPWFTTNSTAWHLPTLRRKRPDYTLQTTALVHEAYLRLVDQKEAHWKGCDHFLAVAAQAMRRILVDHARRHKAVKRGGPLRKLSRGEAVAVSEDQSDNLLLLDRLLTRLALPILKLCESLNCDSLRGFRLKRLPALWRSLRPP